MIKLEKDFSDIINTCEEHIEALVKSNEFTNNAKNIALFNAYYKALYEQIYNVLLPLDNEEAEKQIRDLIHRNVIGYYDVDKGIICLGALPLIKARLYKLHNSNLHKVVEDYLDIYNKFLALAAFRSYKHFCFYMQSVFGITLWEDNERAFDGYWHYTQRMILDSDVVFLEKQLPTGTGKSFSDAFAHAWTFGVEPDAVIFKVCGNDKFTQDCFNNVTKMMTSEKYAQIFPLYAKYKCDGNLMFSSCSTKEGRFSLECSSHPTSLRIVSKLTETSGIRAKYLYIDDICQPDDSPNEMDRDITKFRKEWFRRNSSLEDFYIVASGTSYSIYDILSYLKTKNGFASSVKSDYEFTKVGVSQYIRENGVAIFVTVPALDENDESVFPKIRSSKILKNMREEDYRTFMAMEQQTPLPPDNSPFYYENLREYSSLPPINTCGRTENCLAALDPKRRGRDYVSMPIFFEADDPDGKPNNAFFLVDWLYEDKPMQDCIPLIAEKIINHKITRLVAERNTDECIAKLISDELEKRGYTNCIISDVYSNEPKDKRIMNSEGNIKSRMIFPVFGMYSLINPIGKALNNVYSFSYTGTVLHDDAPDSLSLFEKHFISNYSYRVAEPIFFDR